MIKINRHNPHPYRRHRERVATRMCWLFLLTMIGIALIAVAR